MLNIKGLSKAFGKHEILHDVTFAVEKAQIIGIAGNSGSGKSTLLRLIQKLETPDAGTIEGKARTGFMFQDFQLFPHMTVWQNITYAPQIQKRDNTYIKKAQDIIALLGLAQKIDFYPGHLSGGQKQRVALARALMMAPDILLCDEPTSGLDVATIQDVIALLESVRKLGVSIVIASHDLDFLTQIADTIFVLKNGKLTHQIHPKN
jgi:ABC-type polar amino acid transport system, ATPase component